MTVERAPATGRGVELGLLVFATGPVTLALVLVQASADQQLSWSLLSRGNRVRIMASSRWSMTAMPAGTVCRLPARRPTITPPTWVIT
jgi:hypothetical protein